MNMRIVQEQSPDAQTILVAVTGHGIPAGRASVGVRGRSVFVSGVVVDEHHRGQGVGSMLMAAAEEFAAEEGVAAVELEVERSNGDARRLYERLGYAVVEERACCDSGEPGWVMRKRLAG